MICRNKAKLSTAALEPDRKPPKGWNGRSVLFGNMGNITAAALAEQRRVRVLLVQSRELLKQMQAG
jgi:hypothetical protein